MSIVNLKDVGYDVNISNHFTKKILKKINFIAHPGEFHAIIGPSGCGKTTLLNIIGSLLKPSTGSVELFEKDITNFSEKNIHKIRKNIGYIFQSVYIPKNMSVFEYLIFFAELSGLEPNKAIETSNSFLKEFNLQTLQYKKSDILSGGEKQLVSLLSILISDPQLILLDEPTGSVDYEHKLRIWESIKSLCKTNKTIIVVSHDKKILEYADYTHLLNYGEIFQQKK
ncbi:ATP-binding cassette domain-containing protein [Promethearchaeum syntrophicum]|uniref:ATP-binding cassette domain-containing protein n=1 Tax=Promethearchaeum syntrophicum TaxID=2594042 RepID=A0A5B9DCE8_9ARCH|nr:ATP-binding cassette domain-containing protein [Candidatus Prometheoarchaeum syntrophicum]QEE16430.1 putative ABC transporter ATP-binding protein [Candidatus Prometheoarchaeum syntrophicum]